LIPTLESTKARNLAPKEALADTLYGNDENCQKAKQMDVELVAPASGRQKEGPISLSDFALSQKSEVTSSPEGHAPVMTKTKKTSHRCV
jgi:hypothetical protein